MQHLNFYPGEEFTLFAPSMAASRTLVALLESQGCLSITTDELEDVRSPSLGHHAIASIPVKPSLQAVPRL